MQDPEKKLTHKQYLFCLYYVNKCNYNATQAYIEAGYSENGAQPSSSELLLKPIIQETIAKIEEDKLVAVGLTAENILRDIVDLRKEALGKGQLGVSARCDELLTKILLGANTKGLKGITTNPDGTVKIEFTSEDDKV